MAKLSRRTLASAAAVLAVGAGTVTWAATSAAATPAGTAAVIPRCAPDQLYVWVSPDSGNGAAGSTYFDLDYTNIGKATCYLYSWPGVSAVDDNDKQLGPVAERIDDGSARHVNVAPDGTVHSTLRLIDFMDYPGCKPANATFVKVIPPGDHSAREAYFPATVCTSSKDVSLMVGRVQPGPGRPGA